MFTTAAPVLPYGARLKAETVLKTLNMVVMLGVLACLVVTITDVSTRADRTLEEFWVAKGDFDLSTQLKEALSYTPLCSYRTNLVLGNYDVNTYDITANSRGFLMAHASGLIRRAVLISCATAAVCVLNRVLFNYNIHSIRYANFIVYKGHLVLLEILGVIWSIVALNHPAQLSADLSNYIEYCASTIAFDTHLFDAPPFVAMFVAWGLVLFMHLVNIVILVQHSANPVPKAMKEDWADIRILLGMVPWEGPLPTEVEETLAREMDGEGGDPGIKHLLATELGLLPPEVVTEMMAVGNTTEIDQTEEAASGY